MTLSATKTKCCEVTLDSVRRADDGAQHRHRRPLCRSVATSSEAGPEGTKGAQDGLSGFLDALLHFSLEARMATYDVTY